MHYEISSTWACELQPGGCCPTARELQALAKALDLAVRHTHKHTPAAVTTHGRPASAAVLARKDRAPPVCR